MKRLIFSAPLHVRTMTRLRVRTFRSSSSRPHGTPGNHEKLRHGRAEVQGLARDENFSKQLCQSVFRACSLLPVAIHYSLSLEFFRFYCRFYCRFYFRFWLTFCTPKSQCGKRSSRYMIERLKGPGRYGAGL